MEMNVKAKTISKRVIVNFYPIGWSNDGKFAYYLEPVDGSCRFFQEVPHMRLKLTSW